MQMTQLKSFSCTKGKYGQPKSSNEIILLPHIKNKQVHKIIVKKCKSFRFWSCSLKASSYQLLLITGCLSKVQTLYLVLWTLKAQELRTLLRWMIDTAGAWTGRKGPHLTQCWALNQSWEVNYQGVSDDHRQDWHSIKIPLSNTLLVQKNI